MTTYTVTTVEESSTIVEEVTSTVIQTTEQVYTITNQDGIGIPAGGSTGQVLKKQSNGNYDVAWSNDMSGTIASILGNYRIDANTVGGDPATGHIRYNNATQTSATELTIDHESLDGIDVDLFLELLSVGSALVIQDKDQHLNNQIWEISGTPVHSGATYWTFPVTLRSSLGTGNTGFPHNTQVLLGAFGGGGAVSDDAYNEATWNGVTDISPSKNAVRDKIESLSQDILNVTDLVTFTQFGGF